MSESNNVFPPLDDRFWEHLKHLEFSIGIPISETKMLNILGALEDIYIALANDDTEDAIMCLTALGALLVASKYDKADEVWEELVVKEAMHNFDKHLKEVIDEES